MRVEIWSDVVCPWCYIGKRKFEAALALYEGDEPFDVVWRPFQLDPTAPRDRAQPVIDAYAKKFGGREQASAIIERVTQVADSVGLNFAMDKALRANTLDAHRLLAHVLRTEGSVYQSMLKERLLRAYFSEGHNISDHATLAVLAAEVGLSHDDTIDFLGSTDGLEDLAADFAAAVEAGITGVPHFVFDGRWSIPGAQDPELFLRAFRRMADLRASETAAEVAAAPAAAAGASAHVCQADGGSRDSC